MEPNLLLVRFTVCIDAVFLLAGALSLDQKIRQSAALFRFGLRNDEILYLQAATQRSIDASPAFMEYGLVKKIAV